MATKTFTITNANVSKTFEFRIKKGEMLSFSNRSISTDFNGKKQNRGKLACSQQKRRSAFRAEKAGQR